jgi:O-antigen ligase
MTAFYVIAAIVALVWGIIFLTRGSLLGGCTAYLVLASCFGVYFYSFDAGITFSLDRIFLVVLALAFAVQWKLGQTDPKPLSKVEITLGLFLGWLVLSMITHDWRAASVGQVPVVQHLINGYLIPLALYALARNARLTESNTTSVIIALAGFGFYLSATALLETAGAWSLVFPRYIADPALGLHFGRARGPMVHSVSFGFYLGATALAAWLWRERLGRLGQLLLMLTAPIFLAAIYATKTRSVWVGFGCGLLLVLAATLQGKVRVAVIASMACAALLVGVAKFDSIMSLQREGTAADTLQSAGMRASFTYVSWQMFLDRPLAGFGFGQFADEKLPYLSDRSIDLPLEQIRGYVHHNTFLALLTETGLVGMCLYLAVLGLWSRDAWRLIRAPQAPRWAKRMAILFAGVLTIACWQMIGHEITFMPYEHALLFSLAGITTGLRWQFVGQTIGPPAITERAGGYSTEPIAGRHHYA